MTTVDDRIDASGNHPALEDLAAYSEGRLPAEEAGRIRSHIVDCSDCAGVVLDLSEASDLDSSSAPAAANDLDRSWAGLREAIDEQALWPTSRDEPVRASTGWKALALAASVATVVFAGMGMWLWQQSSARIPSQVDPPWVSLAPVGDLRSGGPETRQTLELAPGVRGWISLAFSAPETVANLRVRFFTESGSTPVWSWSGPRPEDSRILRMELTSQEVSAGDYRVELDGVGNAADPWVLLAEYDLRVAE